MVDPKNQSSHFSILLKFPTTVSSTIGMCGISYRGNSHIGFQILGMQKKKSGRKSETEKEAKE